MRAPGLRAARCRCVFRTDAGWLSPEPRGCLSLLYYTTLEIYFRRFSVDLLAPLPIRFCLGRCKSRIVVCHRANSNTKLTQHEDAVTVVAHTLHLNKELCLHSFCGVVLA